MHPNRIEEKILKFWEEKKIFEKSVKQRKKRPYFSFYDGPPFATGKPHYGHILATTIKDTVLRYWTMKGYQVPRRVGWDCHGLPVENLIEKELHIRNKREIEEYGIEKFNQKCRAAVFRSVDDFEKTLKRVGRWADYENAYATMDNDYIESVWWVLKQLWNRGLIYKDYRVSPYCPRCGTPLSNFEVNQGYKETTDPSIFLKFKVLNFQLPNSKLKIKNNRIYFLVWTTTPWTLLGNVALAINPQAEYALVQQRDENYILAKKRLNILESNFKVIGNIKASKLVGVRYQSLFDNLIQQKPKNIENAFQILPAEFVSLEEGTGIVHIATMYGEEDFQLGKKYNLPFHHTVDESGRFKKEIEKWGGYLVKQADPEIIKNLSSRGFLYRQEEITHSYPFCWRCDTALLYYALDSWYIAVTKIKKQLVVNNKKIHWVPSHLKEGRFGNWLKEARDWAFSRNRFWGAPVPIWHCQKCDRFEVIGSVKELKKKSVNSGNKYFLMRHGQAKSNVQNIINCNIKKNKFALTLKGKKEVLQSLNKLKSKKIDLIFASDFLRTIQTAELVAEVLGFDKKKIIYDKRLREGNFGIFDGRHPNDYHNYFSSVLEKFSKTPPEGENLTQIKNRVMDFLYEIDKRYKNKNILIVSHEYPIWMMLAGLNALNDKETVKLKKKEKDIINTGQILSVDFISLPHNEQSNLDLHRPYIDKIKLKCRCGGEMKRTSEVFDCWFESGAMPYGQWHYPFENKKLVEKTFPADFIAEGLDQTRGWFYTLHVLATALTLSNEVVKKKTYNLGKNQPAFLNVIVNGLILDPQGRKLSKKLGNYPEPEMVFQQYGADALRYFLLTSTPIGEDYRFSEKGVEEVWRRNISTLWHSFLFFKTYFQQSAEKKLTTKIDVKKANSLLDKWILSQLQHLNSELIKWMDRYELTKAARLFDGFIDDLSNWYIRRSRRRFQRPKTEEEKTEAGQTLYFVLLQLAKMIAPFTPFIAEEIYLGLTEKKRASSANKCESVHLCNYPRPNKQLINKKIEEIMRQGREIVTKALAIRMEKRIKVRQPLRALKIKNEKLKKERELLELIKEEVNVKEVIFDNKIKDEVELDTTITPLLKEEGMIREIIRQIQQMRKEAKFIPEDKIISTFQFLTHNESFQRSLEKWVDFIQKETNSKSFKVENTSTIKRTKLDLERDIEVEGIKFRLGIKRI